MKAFNITRIYADEIGESRFESIEVLLTDKGPIGFLSDAVRADELIFRFVIADYDYDFHTAPQRQYIVLLDGQIEIETSLGERKSFSAGDVLLAEDTWGKGHRTRNLVNAVRKSLFITLPDQKK